MVIEFHDNPKAEANWLRKQRDQSVGYIEKQGIKHRGVSEEPEWFVAPYVSLWTVESGEKPGAIGWWVISGDLPTDYLSGNDATDPRSALGAFAVRWEEVSTYMLRGEDHPAMQIGKSENRKELGDLLLRRARILHDWIDDDSLW